MIWLLIWLALIGITILGTIYVDPEWRCFTIILVTIIPIVSVIFFPIAGHTLREKTFSERIYSLNDSNGIEGGFTLGTGGIGTEFYYHFYKDNDDRLGSVSRKKINVENCVIIEDSSREPIHRWKQNVITDTNFWWVHPILVFHHEHRRGDTMGETYQHQLFVPENTVIREFRVE